MLSEHCKNSVTDHFFFTNWRWWSRLKWRHWKTYVAQLNVDIMTMVCFLSERTLIIITIKACWFWSKRAFCWKCKTVIYFSSTKFLPDKQRCINFEGDDLQAGFERLHFCDLWGPSRQIDVWHLPYQFQNLLLNYLQYDKCMYSRRHFFIVEISSSEPE